MGADRDEPLLGEHVLEALLHQLVCSAHQLQAIDVIELQPEEPRPRGNKEGWRTLAG